jgi:hypothetical protein
MTFKHFLTELSKETLASFAGKNAGRWVDNDNKAKWNSRQAHIERMKGSPDHAEAHDRLKDKYRSKADRHEKFTMLAAKKYIDAPKRSIKNRVKLAFNAFMAGKSMKKDKKLDHVKLNKFLKRSTE